MALRVSIHAKPASQRLGTSVQTILRHHQRIHRRAVATNTTTAAPSWTKAARESLANSPIGRLARSYGRAQANRPYATQVCSILVVWLCGDLSAQLLFPSPSKGGLLKAGEANEADGTAVDGAPSRGQVTATGNYEGYDVYRTLRHLTVGVVASIPTYKWLFTDPFMLLHRSFQFKSKVASILTRVVVQQLVYTPVFNAYFFSMQAVLSGASFHDTIDRLKMTLPISIVNGMKVWTGVALVSFTVVPPQFRSVFSGVISVFWQTYLSWMNQTAALALQNDT